MDAIFVFDVQECRFKFANAAAHAQVGLKGERLLGMRPWDIKQGHTRASFMSAIGPLLFDGEQEFRISATHQHAGGLSDVCVNVDLCRPDGGDLIIATARPVVRRPDVDVLLRRSAMRHNNQTRGALPGHEARAHLAALLVQDARLLAGTSDPVAHRVAARLSDYSAWLLSV